MSELFSHLSTVHVKQSGLWQSLAGIIVAILTASAWTVFRNRRNLHGVLSLSQLRGPESPSWIKGNYKQLFNLKHGWAFHKLLAEKYGSVVQVKGFLGRSILYTFDPKAMHQILVKDASLFQPHRIDTGGLVLGKGLLTTMGEQHRKQRKMLNPVFSIAHMRSMMPIFNDVVDQLRVALQERVQDGPREIDILNWMARTALELIGQSGFGYSFDNLVDDIPKNKYSIIIKDLVPALTQLAFARTYLLPLAVKILPTNIRTLIMNILPWKTLHDVRDMSNYMHQLSVDIYEEKKRALEEGDEAVINQIGKGKDLLSIMMKDNMKAASEDRLEEAEIIGQSGMSRILHLLSLHSEVQDKLRQEIIAARRERRDGQLTYDELVELPYLDAVCRETLRLYTPVPRLLRKSVADTIIPLSKPVRGMDGNEVTEIFVPKSTTVVISILNSNRDPELWGTDALEWKPERWLAPLPESILKTKIPGIYSHLMTFSGGSRACIGFKFSQLEMKVVIAMLIENFKFSPSVNKEIFWQMSGVASPVVVAAENGHPQLPLTVEST
ncbi:cytochrome P450 [Lentinula raphanica]|nr:cytochrome P450 [Lentinula raphanica]